MKQSSEPPKKYTAFIERFPKLGEAWQAIHEAEAEGPLDPRTIRLVKLAVAIGAFKEGAVHAAFRAATERQQNRAVFEIPEMLERVMGQG